jgi:hypothetical protein
LLTILALNGAEQTRHIIERPLAHGLPAKVPADPGKPGLQLCLPIC